MNLTPVEQSKYSKAIYAAYGHQFIAFENAVYSVMSQLVPSYDGGVWKYCLVDSESFLMVLNSKETAIHVVNRLNYFEGDLSPLEISVAANMMAIGQLSMQYGGVSKDALKIWHKLDNFIDTLPNKKLVRQLLD